MSHTTQYRPVLAVLLTLLSALAAAGQSAEVPPYNRHEAPGDPPPVPGYETPAQPEEGLEVEGRGPLHEAFAQPGGTTAQPAPVISKEPPEPINELPPDEKPEGNNVVWIPGYWSWDEDRGDFLWVSGFWREAPEGRKWVPGYWARTDDGYRWVSGFWASTEQEEVPYHEAPPPSLEVGPSQPAPGDDYYYVPGNWVHRDGWAWQSGFWLAHQPGYVYTPPRWVWTPQGCVYVSGYWDYPFADRGVLFAPVYFSRPLYRSPGWCYRPRFVVDAGIALGSLWVRPRWGHYAFGDFYGDTYARRGYSPWVTHGHRHRDPLFGYYGVASPAARRNWATTHQARLRGTAPRPPRTLAAQQRLARTGRSAAPRVVQPLNNFRSERFRLTRMSATERAQREKVAAATRQASTVRRTQELRARPRGTRAAPLSLSKVPAGRIGSTPSRAGRAATPGPARPGVTPRPSTVRRTPGSTPAPRPRVTTPAPKRPAVTTRPAPSAGTRRPAVTPRTTPAPRTTPRVTPAPRAATPSPRVIGSTPRTAPRPAPRTVPSPRVTTPRTAPRYSAPRPAPRTSTPAPRPAPRISAPRPAPRSAPAPRYSAPRISTPRPAPRISVPRSAPRSAPRISAPRAVRPATRSAPRPAGRAPAARAPRPRR